MRTPHVHEAQVRIIAFLAQVRSGKGATVIRHNRFAAPRSRLSLPVAGPRPEPGVA